MHTIAAFRHSLLVLCLLLARLGLAHEGMWLPTLLQSIESDLKTAGLRISAEDIYSIERGSIKDAIVLFGGGCTAEVISGQGLILTNHHCGFGQIQNHSSLENDYLKNGFWAANKQQELRNPGLTATFIVRMEDVTDRVIPFLKGDLTEPQRREAVSKLADPLIKDAIKGTHYKAVVRPFNYGNSYFLIVTETFRDVRLVGAPPSSIGKFGADTDNWMWPRHTGDFSMFRIYAGPDNLPADPSDANVPFVPRHVLPINMDGVKEGDFAMIFGFPGSTQRYLTSYAVQHVMEVQDPMRIAMRKASLGVIDAAMRSSDRLRIQYAAKQSSISNAYKKWIGELRGLKELNALEEKRAYERMYLEKAAAQGNAEYPLALRRLGESYVDYRDLANARDLFVEMVYYGPEVLRFAEGFSELIDHADQLRAIGKLELALEDARSGKEEFWKDYDMEVDKRVFKALLPIYRANIGAGLAPDVLKEIDTRFKGNADAWVDDLYARSVFVSKEKLAKALQKFGPKTETMLKADPLYRVTRSFHDTFLSKVRPAHAELSDRIEGDMRIYVKGMMELFPERTYWPDANSTLRLSYGAVEGSDPRDGVTYIAFSTLDGVMEKYVPGDHEFDLPQRLMDLHAAKDYGPYGVNGSMPVCFTSSLHTTGGNSGSPVLNGRGELIGLNFDRTWESTMSDIRFDPLKCRNISVDVRYILFVVDRFAGAKHLVDEMTIAPRMIDLPVHR
ncbi:MAG: S46 family peptidase [Flavobacteriales bacterium]|nr:S46 family peptidase [Flavobacteriales bacterium]